LPGLLFGFLQQMFISTMSVSKHTSFLASRQA
jgi:hypothetical protein